MEWLGRLLFGNPAFDEDEEYQAFQYRFLCVVIVAVALLTGLLALGSLAGLNPIDARHTKVMSLFTLGSLLFWWVLRGHKARFVPIAWTYEVFCLLECSSALYFVSEDEFRVVWFLTNIPAVYLLLGQRPGLAITALTAVGLALGNRHLPSPYSANAMATLLFSIVYLGLFFHFYAGRAVSYFLRMRESNRQLYHLAMRDALTGVLNARAYGEVCDRLMTLARRKSAHFAVLFVDLDHFKSVNDTHGHAAGDLVLRSVAACMQRAIRASDVLGRVGGEEFSLFLPDTDRDAALRVAETLRQAVQALKLDIGPGTVLHITASIGVACAGQSDQSLADIQKRADAAMYEAKKAGRNRVSSVESSPAVDPSA